MFINQSYTAVLNQLDAIRVSVSGYLYQVDFRAAARSRYHTVDRQKRCTCGLGVYSGPSSPVSMRSTNAWM